MILRAPVTGDHISGLLKRRLAWLGLSLLVFSLALFVFSACRPALAAGKPGGAAPSFHYFFAHRALPQTLYRDPDLAVLLALSDKRQEYLASMWAHYWKTFPSGNPASTPPTGAAASSASTPAPAPEGPHVISSGVIGDNTAMALIAMPEPESFPEAYYCCVIVTYTVDKAVGKLLASGLSYYTLEKSVALDFPALRARGQDTPGEESAVTVIGGWTKDGVHHNYGEGPSPDDSSLFLEAVFQLYGESGGKQP